MHERFFFSSHSLEILAAKLALQLADDPSCLFSPPLIVLPHGNVKEWLQMEICQRTNNQSVVGLEFVSWENALLKLAGPLSVPTRAELLAAIWQHSDRKFHSERQKIDFVEHLASLFGEYVQSGLPQNIPEEALWQKQLFEQIFQAYSWKTLPAALEKVNSRDLGPVYLFEIDYLPPAVHRFFLQYRKLNVFRFSPTAMFWEDLCFSSEDRKAHPLLSNWGSLGRRMLSDSTAFPSQEDENYDLELEHLTTLQQLKLDLLLLEKQEFSSKDSSIRCLKTGASKLQEVQILCREISRFAAKGISFSEMRVYAPDIKPYAPLIEFCFDTTIPFRISGLDCAHESPFYQAIVRLFRCVQGRWESKEIFTLFEGSAVYRKAKWQREDVKRFQEWIHRANIRWGLDAAHRRETTEIGASFQERGSWKEGISSLLDSWIFLQPDKKETMSWLEADLFHDFYKVFDSFRYTLLSWKKDKTLNEWAEEIGTFIHSALFLDESSEADRAASRSFSLFLELLQKMGKTFPEDQFPFALVLNYFTTFSSGEDGASLLHGVRFASLESGAILPARVLFMLGMDEENFPRNSPLSSLRLPTCQPNSSEFDRYLFLQAIFAAKEALIFSYSHRSKEDGKEVSPSLLIQELLNALGIVDLETPKISELIPKSGSFLTNTKKIPELSSIPTVLSIQDLVRFFKNPFQYYLKTMGIVLKEEPESLWGDFEFSALERYFVLRDGLIGEPQPQLPLGLFGEAAKVNLERAMEEFTSSLAGWGINPSSIQMLTLKETGNPLKIEIEGKPVLLTGQVGLTVSNGVLHMGRDEIGSFLSKWPEFLCALIANKGHRIHCLRTGKIRDVPDPVPALQAAVELYLRCQKVPFFLHPEWADDLLRKGRVPEECEDRATQWALSRSPEYSLSSEREIWKETLDKVFTPLKALFERGASATI